MRMVFAGILSLIALPAAAEPRQYGNIIYDAPRNWDAFEPRFGAATLNFNAPGGICEYCYVYFALGSAKKGKLTDFLAAQAARFVDPDDSAGLKILQAPRNAPLGTHPAAMMGVSVNGEMHILIAIELKDSFELVAFKGPAFDAADIKESTSTFQTYALNMFERLTFVSEGARPVMPAPTPGDLSGLWWGWSTSWSAQLDMAMRMEIAYRHIMFWPDGYFYDGTPPNGLNPFDAAALTVKGDANFGTYRVAGKTLALTYVTGRKVTLQRDGDGWKIGDQTLHMIDSLPDNTAIDGTISAFFYSGFIPGSGVSGGMSSSSATTFHPDGTYDGSSFGGAFGNFDSGGELTGGFATNSGDNTHGGHYVIRDGLLIQTPNGGGQIRFSLAYRADGNIMIGDQILAHQN